MKFPYGIADTPTARIVLLPWNKRETTCYSCAPLYFFQNYQADCAYPREILDGNELVTKALAPTDPPLIGQLVKRFGVQDILTATRDQPFLASLMCYLGILTLADSDVMGELELRIPNLVIRRLYVERILDVTLPGYEDREISRRAAKTLQEESRA